MLAMEWFPIACRFKRGVIVVIEISASATNPHIMRELNHILVMLFGKGEYPRLSEFQSAASSSPLLSLSPDPVSSSSG